VPNPEARSGDYSELVRRYFAAPAHAGKLNDALETTVSAAAAQPGSGARILLSGSFHEGRWQALRYCVFGCPHLIAAAEWACERFERRPVEAGSDFPLAALMAELSIPVEKTGLILLLEDAFVRLEENRTRALESGG